jgi:hypothetical protein
MRWLLNRTTRYVNKNAQPMVIMRYIKQVVILKLHYKAER